MSRVPGQARPAMGGKAMPDVFDVLGAAHREVEQMLYLIGGAAEPAAELRVRCGALVSAVSRHEEQYSRPAVQEETADGDPLAVGTPSGGQKPGEILIEPAGTAPCDPLSIAPMTRFSRAARAHVAYEERQVGSGFGTALSADEAGWLGEEFAAAAKGLPGRVMPAHPACGGHSFRGPPLECVVRLAGDRGRPCLM